MQEAEAAALWPGCCAVEVCKIAVDAHARALRDEAVLGREHAATRLVQVDREQRGLIEIEDIPMVEAQQRNIIAFGIDARDIPVKQDKHVNEVHRVLRRMYEEQGVVGRSEVTRQAAE